MFDEVKASGRSMLSLFRRRRNEGVDFGGSSGLYSGMRSWVIGRLNLGGMAGNAHAFLAMDGGYSHGCKGRGHCFIVAIIFNVFAIATLEHSPD